MADVTAREVIRHALSTTIAPNADTVLAALRIAGFTVGRWEQVGWRCDPGPNTTTHFTPNDHAGWSTHSHVPVFRRVEGGATGETEGER